ncbi:hypothetical protein LX73_2292 [Fodinibius salinus]|uniref:DNA polymerase beta thumb domain-containing protein n=1 Tax=Fodinibius salinus TaxID=860790 RepID=A0A5D3YF57_9BACT|nr:hypothetical protein [Fodinibius salinus]TYP92046.1 hypothetical protein LX73_2292 [Fodinibius salinus]
MPATAKQKTPLREAALIAGYVQSNIEPMCKRFTIAGSIRRQEPYVGDIEIICIPKVGNVAPPGELFPTEANKVIHHIKMNRQEIVGDCRGYKINKGGNRYYQFMYLGMQVDLFMTTPKQWGRMLAIRTGPAEFTKKMARRWKDLGYKGVDGELVYTDGKEHRSTPKFPTEKSFFKFLRWDYIEPQNRG